MADGFMQPEHTDLLAPYADRYLSEMPGLWQTRDGHLRVRFANALFPYPAVTAEFLTRIDEFLNAGRKVVFSRTLTVADRANTTIATGDLAHEVDRLRHGGDGYIVVHGGISLWRSLARLDLIDE